MALAAGTRLGPYEIISPLGAGGMGEVYRAKDTRLDRTVAIKVLPAHLSSDPELKQRMEREAKAISALQHVNICTLHDIGAQDGTNFLVMEYLEGQTLADRLAKGPLPLDQVLKIGAEIADALEKAHSQGIIHRDLKPANIMLTKGGAKLMDFGLAKPEVHVPSGAVSSMSPTTVTMNLASLTAAASPLTQKGAIVGTFQYIAPEVLQGAPADARSDLFSFGCVLYEMITGRRAFEGKSQLSVFTAILEKDPDPITASQPLTPFLLDRVVRACLAKEPADRFQSAHDLAMDLRWLAAAPADEANSSRQFGNKWLVGAAALLLVGIGVAALAGYRWAKSFAEPISLHAQIAAPEKFALDATGDAGGMPIPSPQGDKIAFVAHSSDTKLLWVRSLSRNTAQPLEGTTGAAHPFWSPDGRYIGFFAGGKLLKIPADGGPVTAIADATNSRGGTWGANDMIVFAPDFQAGLLKVNAQGGGAPSPATLIDRTRHSTHRWPWFLPDGKHFIFLATSHLSGDATQNGVYFGSVDNTESRLIMASDSAAQFASGYLLWRLNSTLVAQSFDPTRGKLSGSPIPVINNLRDDVGVWRSIFAVSQNGVMVYQSGTSDSAKSRLVWFDRSGKPLEDFNPQEATVTDSRALLGVRDIRLSPDNKRVAFANGTGIWTLDLQRKTKTRITFEQRVYQEPDWSRDGKMLVFATLTSRGGGNVEVRSKAADGSGPERVVIAQSNNYHYPGWTPDGKYLTYLWGDGEKDVSLWMVPVSGDAKPVTVVRPPSSQSNLYSYRISPDAKWLAYISDESGQQELYVTSFPDAKGKWRVSADGAAYPVWSANGKELFFMGLNNDFLSSAIAAKGSELDVSAPQRLFHTGTPGLGIVFDVSSDGKRLLINHSEEEAQVPLELVTNWLAELKK
jgi:serine/threonine protein kinase/Tol biopolymer transport system component